MFTRIIFAIAVLFLTGCSSQNMAAFMEGMASRSSSHTSNLMLYGGQGHKQFLGCLNCNEYDSSSVMNSYGNYGSSYSSTSISNSYSEYGSSYSQFSACNRYATNPPVIVDSQGNFYGYFTINQYKPHAIKDRNLVAWLDSICE